MAGFAFDSSGAQDASRPPISLHPAFPAIVALWFAALLGIGSLVLPAALLEKAVTLTGLAEPPLGFLARGLIALGAAVAGAVAGIAIARRVARAHDERPSRIAKFASGARRPISVNEELGGERLFNGRALPVTRRRALAIAEDERPSDFLYMAPLPGNDEEDHEIAFDPEHATPATPEPLELSDLLEDSASPGFAPEFAEPHDPFRDEDEPMTVKQEFQPFAPAPRNAEEVLAGAPRAAEPEPLSFAAPSLARRALQAESEAHFAEPQAHDEVHFAAPPSPVLVEPAPAAPEEPRFRGDWAEAPVTELGMVQLVQRLGASLVRRREQVASVATAAPASALAPPAGFDAAPAEEAAQAMAAYFGKPAASAALENRFDDDAHAEPAAFSPFAAPQPAPRPSVLRPWHGEDDEDELDTMPSFTLPLTRPVVPTIAFDQPAQPRLAEDGEEADADDGSYSSLLAMRNPFAPKGNGFVRIDEPQPEDDAVQPTVVFPGREDQSAFGEAGPHRLFDGPNEAAASPSASAQPATAEADAALRAALATLQRMSGTA
ncbi:MAG TPA: hypothetical protein VI168_19000 [Croceibacterium sp.]